MTGGPHAERPDKLDEVRAFRAGYRHGEAHGRCSPRDAEVELRGYSIPVSASTIDLYCNGSDDGARGDSFRYLLSFTVAP